MSIEEEINEIRALEALVAERKAASLAFLSEGNVQKVLLKGGITDIGELLLKTEEDLLNITNFGQKSLNEVKQKLDERGLKLRS